MAGRLREPQCRRSISGVFLVNDAEPQFGRYKWFVVAMLWCVCFLNYADRQAIFALFPLLHAQLGLSDVQLALVGSSFMWMYAASGPFAGWIGDRFSRKGLILGGLTLWLCAAVATILAHSFAQLVILRAFSGLAEAVYFPAAMSLISSYHGSGTRSRAMAAHQSAVYAGTVGGGVIASLVGERFGWQGSFAAFGSLGVVLLLFVSVLLKEPARVVAAEPKPAAGLRTAVSEVLGSAAVLRLIAAFIGANFVAMVFMVWMPSFLYRKFHMSLAAAGANATVYLAAASVCGVLLGGVLGDALSKRGAGGRMRIQACGVLAGVPFLFLTGWTLSVPLLLGAMLGFGFCKGVYESNLWASLYDVVRPECRATAVGVMNSLGWIGGGLAPLAIAAASARFSMSLCLSATSVVYLLVAALLLWNARAVGSSMQSGIRG
jgi:MFS family permease